MSLGWRATPSESRLLRIMKAFFAMSSLALSVLCVKAQPLPRSTPEAQGISSAALLGSVEAADSHLDVMNSFMLLRHGHVVAEAWWSPYTSQSRHELYSLSKSLTSTASG